MSIEIGLWAIPLIASIITFVIFNILWGDNSPSNGYGAMGQAMVNLLVNAGALILSLFWWLIYALLT